MASSPVFPLHILRVASVGAAVSLMLACGTPAGTPLPKATDYAELTKATQTFKRYSQIFNRDPDVVSVFLTSNNNPRRMVVNVNNEAAYNRLKRMYGSPLDGLEVTYGVDHKPNDNDPIVAVPRVEAPKTWWEKIIVAFAAWKDRVSAMLPGGAPTAVPPVQPVPSVVGRLQSL